MTINQYRACIAAVFAYAERDFFVSDLALSEIWGDAPEAPIPESRIAALGRSGMPRIVPSQRLQPPPVSVAANWRNGLASRTAPSSSGRQGIARAPCISA